MKQYISWLKRIGIAGFFFFLAKGMVWLGIGALAVQGCRGE